MNIEKKQVFISYSRKDYINEDKTIIPGNVISKIKQVLDKAKISYWIDEEGIYSGDQYVPVIANAIKMCDVFLFVSSEASNASEWTSSEIAAARMYKKKIIPLRIDNSPYNDSVILYIAHLDYLDYQANPELALSTMKKSIKDYIEKNELEKKIQQEAIENQKRQKAKEQQKIISDIELEAEELENDERNAELKRRRLQQSLQNIENESERTRLSELIKSKGSIHRKFNEEIKTLKEHDTLPSKELEEKEKLIKQKDDEIAKCKETIEDLKLQIEKKDKEISNIQEKYSIHERLVKQKDEEISEQLETIRKQEKIIENKNKEIISRAQIINYKDDEIKKITDKYNSREAILAILNSEKKEIKQQSKIRGYLLIIAIIATVWGWAMYAIEQAPDKIPAEEVPDDYYAEDEVVDTTVAWDILAADTIAADTVCY